MTDPHNPKGRFDLALDFTMEHEGGWANDAYDRGGLTRFGISSRAHPDVDLHTLTVEQARDIYRREYWDRIRGDDLPSRVALALFDWAVHSGVRTACLRLQSRLPVRGDGVIGPKTLEAVWGADIDRLLLDLLKDRADSLVLQGLLAGEGRFLKGWIRRVMDLAWEVRG